MKACKLSGIVLLIVFLGYLFTHFGQAEEISLDYVLEKTGHIIKKKYPLTYEILKWRADLQEGDCIQAMEGSLGTPIFDLETLCDGYIVRKFSNTRYEVRLEIWGGRQLVKAIDWNELWPCSWDVDKINRLVRGIKANKNRLIASFEKIGKEALNRQENENNFIIGCERGDIVRVRFFLQEGVNIDAVEAASGFTGLHLAIKKGKPEIVKELLKKGANPNIKVKEDLTPILFNSKENYFRPQLFMQISDLLLEAGANIRDCNRTHGFSVLTIPFSNFRASTCAYLDEQVIKYLLEKGADVNVKLTKDVEFSGIFFPAGSTLLDIVSAIPANGFQSYKEVVDFLKQEGAEHGTWWKYKNDYISDTDSNTDEEKN